MNSNEVKQEQESIYITPKVNYRDKFHYFTLSSHSSKINEIIYYRSNTNSDYILSSSDDCTIKIWDIRKNRNWNCGGEKLKTGQVLKTFDSISEEEMALVNSYSRKELKSEDVYLFSVVLCDNDIDRDNERFTVESLFELEKDLALTVSECDKAVTAKNYALVKELCAKAMLQLTERNKKCKALK